MNDLVSRAEGGAIASQMNGAVAETTQYLEFLDRAARDPNVDVAKMTALMDMQERTLARRAEQEFNEAFTAMTQEMPRIRKNRDVVIKDKKQYSYATWDGIFDTIGPILQKHGFSLSFDTAPRQGEGGGITVTGTLLHRSGHKRAASIPIPLENSGSKNNVQGVGSSFSYGKRYTTTMLLNLVVEGDDDDGKAGGTRYITADQKQRIIDLQVETKADTVGFLRHFGIDTLDDMEERNFAAAENMLLQKRQRMAGGAGQ